MLYYIGLLRQPCFLPAIQTRVFNFILFLNILSKFFYIEKKNQDKCKLYISHYENKKLQFIPTYFN